MEETQNISTSAAQAPLLATQEKPPLNQISLLLVPLFRGWQDSPPQLLSLGRIYGLVRQLNEKQTAVLWGLIEPQLADRRLSHIYARELLLRSGNSGLQGVLVSTCICLQFYDQNRANRLLHDARYLEQPAASAAGPASD